MLFREHQQSQWPFWPWILVSLISLIDAIWIAVTPIRLATSSQILICLILVLAAIIAWAADRFRHNACIYVIGNGIAFAMIAWPALRIFNHLTMTIPLPWTDDILSQMDIALGFNWYGYIKWLNDNPLFFHAIEWTYTGLDRYSGGFFIVLAFLPRQKERCFELLALFIVVACLSMVIGTFFPAKGSMAFYHPDLSPLVNLRQTMGTYHLADMDQLRNQIAPVLNLTKLQGLVTFPSFHTAMGVLLIYVCRYNRWLLAISLTLNLSMILTTPLLGGHYFIDLIGGVLITIFSIVVVQFLASFNDKRPSNSEFSGTLFQPTMGK